MIYEGSTRGKKDDLIEIWESCSFVIFVDERRKV